MSNKKEVVMVEAGKLQEGDSVQAVHNGIIVMAEVSKRKEKGNNVTLTLSIFTSNDNPVQVKVTLDKSMEVVTFEDAYYKEVLMRY